MVVLDTDFDAGGAMWGGYLCWVRGIDGDRVVSSGVVEGAGGDAEQEFICHLSG